MILDLRYLNQQYLKLKGNHQKIFVKFPFLDKGMKIYLMYPVFSISLW